MNTFQSENKPIVLVFARVGGLTTALVELLSLNFCRIVVVSDEANYKNINQFLNENVTFLNSHEIDINNINANYIVFISDSVEFPEKLNPKQEVELLNKISYLSKKLSIISLYVFPFAVFPDINLAAIDLLDKVIRSTRDLTGILFIGDLVGPRVNLTEYRILPRIFKDIISTSVVKIPRVDFNIFPIAPHQASKQIVKKLFSFGANGEKVALVSPPVKSGNLPHYLSKFRGGLAYEFTDETFSFPEFSDFSRKEYLEADFEELIKSTLEWFSPSYIAPVITEAPKDTPSNNYEISKLYSYQPESFEDYTMKPEPSNWWYNAGRPSLSDVNKPMENQVFKELNASFLKLGKSLKRGMAEIFLNLGPVFKSSQPWVSHKLKFIGARKRAVVIFSLVILLLLVSPYLFLTTGGLSMLLSVRELKAGNIGRAKYLANASKNSLNLSSKEFIFLTKTPIFGRIFDPITNTNTVALEASDLLQKGFETLGLTSEMVERILGGDGKDISYYSRTIGLDLDFLYEKLAFLESDISDSHGILGYFYNKFFADVSLRDIRSRIVNAGDFIKGLPEMLGEKDKKRYLVLLQNNMELRPTGGFIGSYALVSFDKGRLDNVDVSDVYDADGQLQGHVEPPEPIKKYLGEANWFLRDSNWDPDFPTAAQHAEWFLDKEVDVEVDGVIGIDLEVIRTLVSVLGPLKLHDLNLEITPDNLYETSQKEVEENFFPGSRKKSIYLTSLTRELLDQITKVKKEDFLKIAKSTFESLEERHIQIYLHDQVAQRSMTALGWSGGVVTPSCDGCYVDMLSVIDANVGVNKANYYVKRSMSLDVAVANNLLQRTLSVDIMNNAPSEQYKSYLRVLVPIDATALQIEIFDKGVSRFVNPEVLETRGRKEIGVLVEVPRGATSKIIFRWQGSLPRATYSLLWRKQAGTVADPITVNINTPSFSLTPFGVAGFDEVLRFPYNTTLERDFSID